MYFAIRYNDGYEVCVVKADEDGCIRTHPLRNFGQRQGDAMLFKLHDCPRLEWSRLNAFIKSYDPKKKYERVNERNLRVTEITE